MVRIAMLSMAHVHADGYARQVVESQDAALVCIWDDDPSRGKPAAEKYGVPFVEKMEDAIAQVDAVVVNAETAKHKEVYLAAIAQGKHVFTEKALTITTQDADEVVAAVKQSGIKFMISLPQRSHPETLFMKQAIDRGWLGDVTMMRARIAHAAALDRWFQGGSAWFTDEQLAGGGALFDLGCHTVDAMRWIMGEPESVVAQINNFSGNYDIDDNAVVAVRFKSKALGILDVAFVQRGGLNLWEVFGTEGYMVRGLPGQRVAIQSRKVQANGLDGWFIPTRLPDPLPSPMQQWLGAIERDEPMHISVEDGRNLTQLLEAAYTAAREGREVKL
ncbi:MAG: Gfo/Idh/MocA family oxidoreductase [Abditibacteriales bacterium]|nr:Gfo/Idh/MocA family oxidoreductase [Abditibacteriales bacterium]MDW8365645.1 Gfo/Idh/MocA family oxidoreductase [Abditibacteriales bacterium]